MNESFETRCVHGTIGEGLREEYDPVSFPIFQTAAFSHTKIGHNDNGFDYSREMNPTRRRLEEVVKSLEGAADALALSSGMAAIDTILEFFEPGDHIIFSLDLYGGVFRLHNLVQLKNSLEVDYLDTTDVATIEAAIRPETKALYIETPTNPTMMVSDIRACAELAHRHGMLLIVDNTFLTPYFQNPISLGADVVIHSGSKFLAGHNDTIAGFLCTADVELCDRARMISKTTGCTLAPFDSWLTMRGIKTLAIRMQRQQESALAIARWLDENPKVTEVLYPGLPSFKGYDVNCSQVRGFGSMISFHVTDADVASALLNHVKVITFAESLGGTESLITYPLTQTHCDTPDELRQRLGISDTLVRLSVGLENADDLINDLDQAMNA